MAMPRRSTPTSPPIRRAPRPQIADTCWRSAISTARSRTAAGTATRRNPIGTRGPVRQRERLSSCCGGDARGARSWHELAIPVGTCIEDIRAEGSTFRIRVNDDDVTTTGDEVFRVIADCSFGPRGFSEAEIARGFDKLAGRAPLEVVGPAEPDALLGPPCRLSSRIRRLGGSGSGRSGRRATSRPASMSRLIRCLPMHRGGWNSALARAREIVPGIEAQVTAGARLVQAIKPDFATSEAPRLLGADFRHDGSVHISIDDGFDRLRVG